MHHAYADPVAALQQQQGWLIDLQRILETEPAPDGQTIAQRLDTYLLSLEQREDLTEGNRELAQHIIATFRHRWWGLFKCYDTPDLPATNNALESFFGRLKTNQRRITGRKSVNNFVLRYGAYAAFVDHSETKTDLLHRLRQVDRALYQQERQQLHLVLAEQRDHYRFNHKLDVVVKELEDAWQIAVETASRSAKLGDKTNLT